MNDGDEAQRGAVKVARIELGAKSAWHRPPDLRVTRLLPVRSEAQTLYRGHGSLCTPTAPMDWGLCSYWMPQAGK
jgi:hypothetical protein